MKKSLLIAGVFSLLSTFTQAADYILDTRGAHASINFKVKHLGYSWLTGRFNTFDGKFSYDKANPQDAKITIDIDTRSVDSNHAERDKHLRDSDFLHVKKYPNAKFVSSRIEDMGDGKLKVTGSFTLLGKTKPITIDAHKIGEGDDPWGGYRTGFSGTTQFDMGDFGMKKNFGSVVLDLHIEGIKQ